MCDNEFCIFVPNLFIKGFDLKRYLRWSTYRSDAVSNIIKFTLHSNVLVYLCSIIGLVVGRIVNRRIEIFLRTNSCENILHLSNDKNAMKKGVKNLQIRIFVLPLQSQSANGALVQLVRIRACHARGQGFESPTHRETLIASD